MTKTMILRSALPSPFGRKVKIAAKVLGLWDEIDLKLADTTDPADDLRKQNPLGKIPTLIPDGHAPIYDSAVIMAYLDARAGGAKIIPADASKWDVLTLEALADGMMDAAILQVYEKRFRPEEIRHAPWVGYQADKVTRGLDYLSENLGRVGEVEGLPNVGQITTACTLGYLDFRFEGAWRTVYPTLVSWLDRFDKAVPAFAETAPPKA
ncbi:glutathione S-transferase family protein [Futiania mangrovi]|uniref:Glutathione S-transferase family protein n=1 Tax=Futiania mangrovi TaxID=2959716 RepID=A0A9J6PDG1_9PROT|nr:glutathione S-transferase family protein [Futiania mangrovii]MCP1337429.1 glutathione S-transferase family protein [Futiania mangrovii]